METKNQETKKRKSMSKVANDIAKDIDWEQRRYEIAKDALAKLIETKTTEIRVVVRANGENKVVTYTNQPEAAVWYADALICALKEKNEKSTSIQM